MTQSRTVSWPRSGQNRIIVGLALKSLDPPRGVHFDQKSAGRHSDSNRGRASIATEAVDRARQGTGLPHLRRGQRPFAQRDRRSRADRRHRQHDQRYGHPGVRKGARRRIAAVDGCHGGARRGGGRGSHRRARQSRCGIRPHHRSRAHVHARDGHGRAADPRGRDPHRQAHRGRAWRRSRSPSAAIPAPTICCSALRDGQGRPDAPGRRHRRLRRSERAGRNRAAAESEDDGARARRSRERRR